MPSIPNNATYIVPHDEDSYHIMIINCTHDGETFAQMTGVEGYDVDEFGVVHMYCAEDCIDDYIEGLIKLGIPEEHIRDHTLCEDDLMSEEEGEEVSEEEEGGQEEEEESEEE
jgi:hypothetical protein